MFLQACLSTEWHSRAAFTIFLMIPYKDIHRRNLPKLSERGKNDGIWSMFKVRGLFEGALMVMCFYYKLFFNLNIHSIFSIILVGTGQKSQHMVWFR